MIPLVASCYTAYDYIGSRYADDDEVVRTFEEEFAEYVGCVGGVAVNSGTSALTVALRALGDDLSIAIPSYTCRALLDATDQFGGFDVMVDNRCDVRRADFGVWNVPSVDILVLSHMFGTANHYTGPVAIDDITLSLGAVHSPRIGVCSFNRDKMISTGRGGMIVAQDDAFLDRCRRLAHYDKPMVGEPIEGHYSPAFSFGMTGMQAALGRSQLRQLPGFIERRREIAARYTHAFREVGIETPDPDVESVFFRYIIGVEDPAGKVGLLAGRGVEAGRGVNPPLHRLLGLPNEQFPGAEECYSKLLSIPVHPGLSDEQVDYVIEKVLEVCA